MNQKGGSTNSANWRTRTFSYDSLSRLLTATNPEYGTISYSYDANGNLSSKTSPAPNQTGSATVTLSYCYDALNRLTSKAYSPQSCPMSSPVATYLYDQSSYSGLTIANGIGRRTGMTDQAGSEAWSYDVMGRIANDQRTTNGVKLQTPYTYNLDGSVATITYPALQNPLTVTFQPGGAGRPISESSNDATYALNVHYTPNGTLCFFQQGWGVTTTTNWTFNNRFQPTRIYMVAPNVNPPAPCTTPTLQANVPVDFSYSYTDANGHNNGNVTQIASADWTRTQSFTYDSLNRVATAKTAATNQPAYNGDTISIQRCWGELFGYDPWGNLLSISSVSSSYTGCTQENLSVAVNTKNQIIGNTYDAAGNLWIAQPGNVQYTYDAENRLISTAGQTYFYDGDGKRVEKASGSPLTANKLYWYDQSGNAFYETDATGNELYRYFRFGGLLVAREEWNDWVDHYGLDALGNVRWVYGTNNAWPNYTVDWDISDYYPFGGERVVKSNSNNNRKFTGKERDSESGNDNFAARYYSSSLGRFTSPDPENAGASLGSPQSWNAYSYVLNNPLNYIDPDGLDCAYLNDSGSAADNIDQNSNIEECEGHGGYWANGSISRLSWVQPNVNQDTAVIYSQFGSGGIGVSLASQTWTQGAFGLSDEATPSITGFEQWTPITSEQETLLGLRNGLSKLPAVCSLGVSARFGWGDKLTGGGQFNTDLGKHTSLGPALKLNLFGIKGHNLGITTDAVTSGGINYSAPIGPTLSVGTTVKGGGIGAFNLSWRLSKFATVSINAKVANAFDCPD